LPKYRIDLKYVGTGFVGWQSQTNGESIQDHVERALRHILGPVSRLSGAARTDSGVHAFHQVATFICEQSVDPFRLQVGLQSLLPEGIGISKIEEVPASFHALKSAKAKVYRYQVLNHALREPFLEPYAWRLAHYIDVANMVNEAKTLVGTHDFSSFCATDSNAKTRIRNVVDIGIRQHQHLIEFWVLGDGFLKQMVRNIVGTLIYVGTGKFKPGTVSTILQARDRQQAGPTAPALGLTLVRIVYEENVPPLAEIMSEF